MTGRGLAEVVNPSALFFVGSRRGDTGHRRFRRARRNAPAAHRNPGACCALTARDAAPRRRRLGSESARHDPSRCSKRARDYGSASMTFILNVAGGLRINEPAADLAAAAALVSSLTGQSLPPHLRLLRRDWSCLARFAPWLMLQHGSRRRPSLALRKPLCRLRRTARPSTRQCC